MMKLNRSCSDVH